MKKLISVALAGTLALSLAACGSSASSSAAESTAPAESEAASTSEAASEATTDLAGTTLKVGASPAPHAEILEVVKDLLAEQGIDPGDRRVQRLRPAQHRPWRTATWTPTTSSTSPT